jgi:predicted unusual protein kinase regulating ubiquinone biosynthesis (AarF/ABC1/UbiB family)
LARHLRGSLAIQVAGLELGCFHADPNPSNFAFRNHGTVIMDDFGCVSGSIVGS